jgi:hypothetical protein
MRRLLLSALFAALAVPAARAQAVSIYATFSPAHISGTRNGSTPTSVTTSSYWAPGVGGGVTLNFLPVGPVRLGFDFRGATKRGSQGYDLAMVGLRAGFKAANVSIKPYLQASGGYLASRVDYGTSSSSGNYTFVSTGKFAVYEILGGIDYGISRLIDLRVIEVGAGQAFDVGGITFSSSSYRPTIFTVNTGIVFHF